ncbi:MAG: NUDIX domain-containing protein [Candidatus Parcubacteria bacterium]|nr:NUDIX domain-containing protein [Candidatus Parcubacteria bacterium]
MIISEKNYSVISKELLEKSHKDKIEKNVVRLIIKQNDAILMLKRTKHDHFPDLYEPPGGGLEENEDIFSAGKRELYEETGLSIKEFVSIPEIYDFHSVSLRKYRGYVLNVLLEKGEIILNPDEHSEYRWVVASEVDSLPMFQNIRMIIKKFF